MKRIGNLFNRIISYENLVRLQKALIEDTYRTSEYCVYTIIADRGNKEREIYRLPYYPDRIVHHAIMNVIEPYLVNRFTADTFNCLKGRGIHYWQIFPVEVRGIDFIGYVFYHDHTLLRKDIKKKFIYKLGYKSKNKRLTSLAAYWGWCKYGNCHNLWYRFTRSYNFKDYRQKLLSSYGIKESTR